MTTTFIKHEEIYWVILQGNKAQWLVNGKRKFEVLFILSEGLAKDVCE